MRIIAVIIAAALACPLPAAAQTYYARQNMKQVRKDAATPTPAPPAVPGTVSCSDLTMGVTAYPETANSGVVANTTSMAAAFAACNTVGAQYGPALKDFNYCRTYKAMDGVYYTYFVKGTGVYNYGDNAYARETYGNATCRYNP